MAEMNSGDAIVQILKAWGVEVVFGIISIHNIPIYDAIARQGGIRAIASRSEPGAVNMADAYARASGKLGVAITSTGGGAGNAAGALVEAQTAGSPVLHLTGQIDSAYVDKGKGYIHECKDQLGMLQSISKAAYRPISAAAIPQTLQTAIQQALVAPRGVVSLELPIDYQKASTYFPDGWLDSFAPLPLVAPNSIAIEQLVEVLSRAKRPLIWAGGGVVAADAGPELQQVAEILGAGVLTSNAGRGSLPENHPLCIGNFANQASVRPLLEQADVLLAVGTHFRGSETISWKLPLPPTIVQIDVEPLAIGRSYPVTAGLVADAKPALAALASALKTSQLKPDPEYKTLVAHIRETAHAAFRDTLGPYAQIMDTIRASLDRDALIVRDVTIPATTWGNRMLQIYEPRTSIHAAGGGIGQGFQMALGAKLAQPTRQVLVMCGDGGFMVNLGEMATAVQEKLNIVAILFNDGGYGVLRNIQNKNYGERNIAVNLHTPDFVKVAQAFGLWATRVERLDNFESALHAALAANQPAIIEINQARIGPMNQIFAGPNL